MIKEIKIKHVKGIQDLKLSLDIVPNKPAILVAPNGYGKSSISTAFKSLNKNRIAISDEHRHRGDDKLDPEVRICFEEGGVTLELAADKHKNEIANHFDVVVINSLAKAKGKKLNTGRFTAVSADFVVEPIVLVQTIPEEIKFDYSFSTIRGKLGSLGKIMPNISCLKGRPELFVRFDDAGGVEKVSKLTQVTSRKAISELFDRIDAKGLGSKDDVDFSFAAELPALKCAPHLRDLAGIIAGLDFCKDEKDSYLIALQFWVMFESNISILRGVCKYARYQAEKNEFRRVLADFNSTWQDFVPREKKGSLVIEFPKLHHISNGQRDVMCFVVELMKVRRVIRQRPCILIIDEIFDYLDEANLVAAQYFLSNLVADTRSAGGKLYPMLMTHLAPELFVSYVFGNKTKLQVYYLAAYPQKTLEAMRRLLVERNKESSPLKAYIENMLLHFQPAPTTMRKEFAAAGLKETWGEPGVFYAHIESEVRKYLAGDQNYDPMGVCCATRVRIEKNVYDKIASSAFKDQFINGVLNGTVNKLDYASSVGVDVPESYYLLGVIYNEALHWKDVPGFVGRVTSRLQNVTIRRMIESVFQ